MNVRGVAVEEIEENLLKRVNEAVVEVALMVNENLLKHVSAVAVEEVSVVVEVGEVKIEENAILLKSRKSLLTLNRVNQQEVAGAEVNLLKLVSEVVVEEAVIVNVVVGRETEATATIEF